MIRIKVFHVSCLLRRQLNVLQVVTFHRSSDLSKKRDDRKRGGIIIHRKTSVEKPVGITKPKLNAKTDTVKKKSIDELVEPVKLKYTASADVDVGKELTGELNKDSVLKSLNLFLKRPNTRKLSEEYGLKEKLFDQTFMSFRKFCMEQSPLPPELHILFSDLAKGHAKANVDDLFPHFIAHARKVYPHLQFMDELKKISDLRLPHNWYQEARNIQRKIIFHAGPTNSGKTYQALEKYFSAKSGIYLGPLKLLASEVFHKTNNAGIPCDLITGTVGRTLHL